MEQTATDKVSKNKKSTVLSVAMRIKRETRRRIQAELAKVNKKAFGRRVRVDALISKALYLITAKELAELQNASLTNADRLDRCYLEFVKRNGPLSKDGFIGKLLAGEVLGIDLKGSEKAL